MNLKNIAAISLLLILSGCTTEADQRTKADMFRLAEYRCENYGGLYEVIRSNAKSSYTFAYCNNGLVVHLIETDK